MSLQSPKAHDLTQKCPLFVCIKIGERTKKNQKSLRQVLHPCLHMYCVPVANFTVITFKIKSLFPVKFDFKGLIAVKMMISTLQSFFESGKQ